MWQCLYKRTGMAYGINGRLDSQPKLPHNLARPGTKPNVRYVLNDPADEEAIVFGAGFYL